MHRLELCHRRGRRRDRLVVRRPRLSLGRCLRADLGLVEGQGRKVGLVEGLDLDPDSVEARVEVEGLDPSLDPDLVQAEAEAEFRCLVLVLPHFPPGLCHLHQNPLHRHLLRHPRLLRNHFPRNHFPQNRRRRRHIVNEYGSH